MTLFSWSHCHSCCCSASRAQDSTSYLACPEETWVEVNKCIFYFYIDDNSLIQMMDEPTRRGELLDLRMLRIPSHQSDKLYRKVLPRLPSKCRLIIQDVAHKFTHFGHTSEKYIHVYLVGAGCMWNPQISGNFAVLMTKLLMSDRPFSALLAIW